ncbi:MAG: hypothetical protein IPK83_20850 [Planctomycetes bacterium]|nr:hypothetical protein [Planctomycetota bacterium]
MFRKTIGLVVLLLLILAVARLGRHVGAHPASGQARGEADAGWKSYILGQKDAACHTGDVDRDVAEEARDAIESLNETIDARRRKDGGG